MLIKVSDGYLDFNDSIEIERQAKLFEDISTSDGDFSYQFTAPLTSNNIQRLRRPFPDASSKIVYQKIPCDLLDDEGNTLYTGSLRVERITKEFELSFFGGNNNWFSLLSGSLQEIDWSAFDIDQTEANIQIAIFNTEGVVFPLIDNGLLNTRGFPLIKVEDFVAGIYVKTVFKKIFDSHSIKLEGDLLEDPNFLAAITLKNPKSQEQIDTRSTFAFTNNSPNPNDSTYHKMAWTDDTTTPYFDGSQNLFDLSNGRYTADVKMRVRVNLVINQTLGIIGLGIIFKMAVYVNGVLVEEKLGPFGGSTVQTFDTNVILEAGDYLEIFTYNNAAFWDDPITDATLKITPTYVYKAFGSAIVPSWTQQQYVSNFLRMFNGITSYNPFTKTLTINKFEDIKSKDPLDLSPYIAEVNVDYGEFISNYAMKNYFSFGELDNQDIKSNFIPYSKGQINAANDFLEATKDVLESDFTQPIGYINGIFTAHFEKTDLIEFEDEIEVEVTGVTDSGTGEARFAVAEDEFALSDMVRVTDSTISGYNGDYMVSSLGAGYIELSGVAFDADARMKITKMNFIYNESDNVYVFHHVPLYQVEDFSSSLSFRLENTDLETYSYAFFNLIDIGRQVNEDFRLSLSFAQGDNPLTYQETMLDQYFRQFSKVLNDPVKLLCVLYLPHLIYRRIDFLRPIQLTTQETTNLYYCNKISGYEGGDCLCEFIKLP